MDRQSFLSKLDSEGISYKLSARRKGPDQYILFIGDTSCSKFMTMSSFTISRLDPEHLDKTILNIKLKLLFIY